MRCLVVGIGGLAMGQYLPFLTRQEDLELAYLSRRSASSRAAQDAFGGHGLDSWSEVEGFAPDIAFNLATDSAHAHVLESLIEARVPRVFTEKPLISQAGQENVDEDDFFRARDIVGLANEAGFEIAMGFNYRFFESVQDSLDAVAGARLGPLRTVVANSHFATWSHTLDLIGMACGPIATLTAMAGPGTARDGRTPTRSVSFRAVSGAVGSALGSALRDWEDDLLDISFSFDGGHLRWRDLDAESSMFEAASGRRTVTVLPGPREARYSASFTASLTAYLAAVRTNAPPPVGVDAGLRELQMEASISRSIREHRAVRVQEEFPLDAS
ncbi:hypothetical protein GCM10022200_24480 [Microbacterium awajiense]|uniref:Gfo/Idh/MocA-like oxidoreductase N-terminal domain-containing protein n=1 Tax=Microbacterium awajiense TaxID=415214 RepID=A0ABP7ATV8_9MICO